MKNNLQINKLKEKLISSYDIEDDNIIINYIDDTIDIIPFSFELERVLIKKIHSQISSTNYSLNNLVDNYSFLFKILVYEVLILILFVVFIYMVNTPLWFPISGTIFFPVALSLTSHKLLDYKKSIDKTKKQLSMLKDKNNSNKNKEVSKMKDEVLEQRLLNNKIENTSLEFYYNRDFENDIIDEEIHVYEPKVLSKRKNMINRK